MKRYGIAPGLVPTMQSDNQIDFEWHEMMHYLYLPVKFPGTTLLDIRLPERLEFTRQLIGICALDFNVMIDDIVEQYIYLTVRHGFASPDNPLNRPGWHADGFGGADINYVWCDKYPTRFALQEFTGIVPSHVTSTQQFEEQLDPDKIFTYPDKVVLRLNPYVVHTTPDVPAPGGMRRFIKVSISNQKYNLKGNSHNYLFDYNWRMFDRDEIRNDPSYAGRDYYPNK